MRTSRGPSRPPTPSSAPATAFRRPRPCAAASRGSTRTEPRPRCAWSPACPTASPPGTDRPPTAGSPRRSPSGAATPKTGRAARRETARRAARHCALLRPPAGSRADPRMPGRETRGNTTPRRGSPPGPVRAGGAAASDRLRPRGDAPDAPRRLSAPERSRIIARSRAEPSRAPGADPCAGRPRRDAQTMQRWLSPPRTPRAPIRAKPRAYASASISRRAVFSTLP